MALALALRNAARFQAGAGILRPNYYKCVSVISMKDLSLTSCQSQCIALNKSNVNLTTMPLKQITVSQSRLMSADHSKLWPIEKGLSVALLVLIPATIAVPNVLFDTLTAIGVVVHSHWGLEAVVVDYVRPIVVGNVLPKLALGLLYLITATTLGGLIYYNVSDIGIGKTIRKFWAIKN